MKPDLYIGIDTGVNTGWAIYDPNEKKLTEVQTMEIHNVILRIAYLHGEFKIKVRIEDARLRKWFKGGKEKAQGVGSVKRDAKILEDFCKDKGIPYEMVAPKNNKTKMPADLFKKMTGWNERCSVHGRDAGMLVYGF